MLFFNIYNRNDVSTATEEIRSFISTSEFDGKARLEIITAAREAMFNVVKYATKGSINIKNITTGSIDGVEIVVDDTGIGISDIEKALLSGYSSSGTMGIGLNVLINSMDETIIVPKKDGIKFIMRKYTKTIKQFCSFYHKFMNLDIVMKSTPYSTYEKSGDCGIALQTAKFIFFAHWDVEGHNSDKVYQTSLVIYKYMLALHYYDTLSVLKIINNLIFNKLSLGRASIAVGRYDKTTKDIDILRLGNINYMISKNKKQIKSLSANGVLGAQSIAPESFKINSNEFERILFYSDGIDSSKISKPLKNLESYEMVDALLKNSASKIDDASILLLDNHLERFHA